MKPPSGSEKTNPNKANFKLGTYSLTGLSGFITMVPGKIRDNCGGDWCLVVPLVFKASVGLIRSRVGSIPIRLRHLLQRRIKAKLFACTWPILKVN